MLDKLEVWTTITSDLMKPIVEHPDMEGFRRWSLVTNATSALYEASRSETVTGANMALLRVRVPPTPVDIRIGDLHAPLRVRNWREPEFLYGSFGAKGKSTPITEDSAWPASSCRKEAPFICSRSISDHE